MTVGKFFKALDDKDEALAIQIVNNANVTTIKGIFDKQTTEKLSIYPAGCIIQAIALAVENNYLELLESLITRFEATNFYDRLEKSYFQFSKGFVLDNFASKGNLPFVKFLCNNFDFQNHGKEATIRQSYLNGHLAITQFLLEKYPTFQSTYLDTPAGERFFKGFVFEATQNKYMPLKLLLANIDNTELSLRLLRCAQRDRISFDQQTKNNMFPKEYAEYKRDITDQDIVEIIAAQKNVLIQMVKNIDVQFGKKLLPKEGKPSELDMTFKGYRKETDVKAGDALFVAYNLLAGLNEGSENGRPALGLELIIEQLLPRVLDYEGQNMSKWADKILKPCKEHRITLKDLNSDKKIFDTMKKESLGR